MDIITGYTGTPHITAENDRDINIGISGNESYVLRTGMRLTAEISSNNEIKVRDGVIMHQGCAASIKKNTYDSVAINNGSQGMERVDLIVARYEKQPETNVESLTLKVLQGIPAEESPQVPEHIEGDIQAGDTVADMPLYKVKIDGLNIVAVEPLFKVLMNMSEIEKMLTELNGKLHVCGIYTCNLSQSVGGAGTNKYGKGKFHIHEYTGNGAHLDSDGGLTFEKDCFVTLNGVALLNNVKSGDVLHCIVGKTDTDIEWHGQNNVSGNWSTFSLTPNMRKIKAGQKFFPFVKCEQGSNSDYLQVNSTFTFLIYV